MFLRRLNNSGAEKIETFQQILVSVMILKKNFPSKKTEEQIKRQIISLLSIN